MDKSWMKLRNRFSAGYKQGVEAFIKFAENNVELGVNMRCPCIRCLNFKRLPTDHIKGHLIVYGISPAYKVWCDHGEIVANEQNIEADNLTQNVDNDEIDGSMDNSASRDEVDKLMVDIINGTIENDDLGEFSNGTKRNKVKNLFSLLEDVQRELYPGCKSFSVLSFVVKMFHMKVLYKWTNSAFDEILKLEKQLLPKCDEKVPWSMYEVRKFLRAIGLGYEVIHACKYDCALFWKENAHLNKCPVCEEPRYEVKGKKVTNIPQKVLRYFPLVPRLKRLFMSTKTAEDMKWHKDKRVNDGILRHPADGEEWKEFDQKHLTFSAEARNVRLGLASDGFNPFGEQGSTKSLWHVIVTPYNLPPWKCMKEPYCIMSLLIPGPSQPGRDIDVYLRPLIDELKSLWEVGVSTYDATTGKCFQMYVAVMWTINDFPAYANLSGWSTKGYFACPICNKNKSAQRLIDKIGYTGARRYLPEHHRWRKSKLFDGKPDHRLRPADLSSEQILEQLDSGTYLPFGKNEKIVNRKINVNPVLNWKKKSIFWELPYWKTLKIRHNLDVMHIEKNICDNVLSTLLNLDKKSKDTDKARMDLENLGIRKDLHLRKRENRPGFTKPAAPYTLSLQERRNFCEFLNSVKYPDGYASNISACSKAKEGKVTGLKSHDCHVLLQRILPIGMRGYLDNDISSALFELGDFFRQLCSRTLRVSDLEKLQENIILVLCKLELIFPPAFF